MCENKNFCKNCNVEIDMFNIAKIVKGKIYFSKKLKQFCSEKCAGNFKSEKSKIDFNCYCCDKIFKKSKKSIKKFCSKKCCYVYRTITKSKKTTLPILDENKNYNIFIKNKKPKNKPKNKMSKETYIKWNDARKRRGLKRKLLLVSISGGSCNKCGYKKCLRSLCFHHVNPKEKSFTLDISNLYKKKLEVLLEEHKKCILLCQNCHAILHEEEREKYNCKNRLYRKNSKNKILEKYDFTCQKCNIKFNNYQCLSFHHINKSEKYFELNSLNLSNYRISEKDIENELKKCICVCLNCHMELENLL